MIPFGKYDLIEPIAVGGMAEVFKARTGGESGFEQILAIKRILPQIAAEAEFVSMFIDEAKIAVQLTHSNIAQIFDLGVQDGAYFIALEYVHGRDLRRISQTEALRGGVMPIPIACAVAMQVAEALDYAHRAESPDGRPLGVIHRDVSPQNVLVSFDGEVKVIDFGLAKAAGRITQTRAGMLKGKLAYLSPEQVSGGVVDWRSDLYALGILLWELLTGQRLFLRDNDMETVAAVRNGVVPSVRAAATDVPHELDAIVLRALERDPSRRYQRAQELHDALEAFLYRRGELVTRRRLATYLRELYPEEVLDPDELADAVGLELIDDGDPGTTSPVPEELRLRLIQSARGSSAADDASPRSSFPPPATTAESHPDPDLLTLDEPIEPIAPLATDASWDDGTTAVASTTRRDTIPAPAERSTTGPLDVPVDEESAPVRPADDMPPLDRDAEGDTTAVTLWTEEHTATTREGGPRGPRR